MTETVLIEAVAKGLSAEEAILDQACEMVNQVVYLESKSETICYQFLSSRDYMRSMRGWEQAI
jgi:hypothetical protein